MPKIVTEADRQAMRQRILNAAAHEIATYGFDGANVPIIAGRAGIGRGTIYLYFTSKEEIMTAILDGVGRRIDETVERCLAEDLPWPIRFENMCLAFASLAQVHKDEMRMQLHAMHGGNPELSAPTFHWLSLSIDRLGAALRLAAAAGEVASLPPDRLAHMLLGILSSLVLLPSVSAEDARIIAQILWRGIAPG